MGKQVTIPYVAKQEYVAIKTILIPSKKVWPNVEECLEVDQGEIAPVYGGISSKSYHHHFGGVKTKKKYSGIC